MGNIELWKPIKGYEGIYEISSLGRVRSLDRCITRILPDRIDKHFVRGKILSNKRMKSGYEVIGLHKEGKSKFAFIHRLVASAFVSNPNNFNEVNHRDENKSNNNASNLEWCTRKYNNAYGGRSEKHDTKLMIPVACYSLEGEYIKSYPSITSASIELGVYKSSVWAAITGKCKTCKGMIWEYDRQRSIRKN